MRLAGLLAALLILSLASGDVSPGAAAEQSNRAREIERLQRANNALGNRIDVLEAKEEAAVESRDRLADSVSTDAQLFTYVSGALVVLLSVVGLGGTWLAYRSVKNYAEARVDAKAEEVLRQSAEAVAREVVATYEQKFADLYDRYDNVMRRQQERTDDHGR